MSTQRNRAIRGRTPSHKAGALRDPSLSAAERSRSIDLALVGLASLMSETEVAGLVNALRHAATATQDNHVCELCGSPTEPWSMLVSDSCGDDELGSFIQYSWDQYGYTLCKHCHLAVHRARWQAAAQM